MESCTVRSGDWVPEVPGSLEGRNVNELHLSGSRCSRCGRVYFPLRKNCPNCLDNRPMEQSRLSDRGVLRTFVVASIAPPGYPAPHAQGYIHLCDGGPLIFSLLTDYEGESSLRIGCEMVLKIINLGRDPAARAIVGYRFRPLQMEK